ncbi:GxxExxY protein [Sorangium sp. So ce1151]|uniref:GxxExxY protein n=1 Tax=Sorangium sp. So ce1151 TaxID=3133332 RepID=UPI003F5E004E
MCFLRPDVLPVCRGAQHRKQQRFVGRETEKREYTGRRGGGEARESTYKGGGERCGPSFERARRRPLPVIYKGVTLDRGYRRDVGVEEKLVPELKAVDHQLPVHEAQALTDLKLTDLDIDDETAGSND